MCGSESGASGRVLTRACRPNDLRGVHTIAVAVLTCCTFANEGRGPWRACGHTVVCKRNVREASAGGSGRDRADLQGRVRAPDEFL